MNPLVTAGADMAWHGFKRFISVMVWLLVIVGIGWAIYAGIIRPTTKPNATTRQEAQQIINYNHNYPKAGFGCMRIQVYEDKK